METLFQVDESSSLHSTTNPTPFFLFLQQEDYLYCQYWMHSHLNMSVDDEA